MSSPRPLDGITVIALEHAIAAPLCSRQLADLGARVIKVERRDGGDFARAYDARVNGLCSHFVWTNRSKESLTLDIKQSKAIAVLNRLLERADVLLQNLAPGASERLGLTYKQLKTAYPQLVVCDISGYGDAGPYKNRKAYDLLVQSEAGLLSVTGSDAEPAKSGISIADISAASQACSAILAALLQRGKTARGSHLQISLLESMVEWMGYPLYYGYQGAEAPPRSGADHASIFPYGAFAARDGELLMLGLQNEREWQSFCSVVLDREALATDSRFCTNALRSSAREALRAIINEIFTRLSSEQITARLDRAAIAWARVNDVQAVWSHPQLQELKRITTIQTPVGAVSAFLPPGNNSDFSPRMDAVPALGQHSESILREFGFSTQEISELRSEAVV
jgi:itaconate CoA-transferase